MDKGFQFKHNSQEDQQKQIDDQHLIDDMELIKDTGSKNIYSIKNDNKVKHSEQLFKNCTNSQFSTYNSENLNSLHDPYDLNHIHGLRNRMFKTFSEFAGILENALLPSVLKRAKKVQIKIKECDQQTSINYINNLNSLLSEIKTESKNENLHNKKNKSNAIIRKMFQVKVIQCYKLAIHTTQICSKTLEAGIYNPVQSKMKKLIQIISSLSFITGKYIYGELFKKKKKESFDLGQCCKVLESMLNEYGYIDTENEDYSKYQKHNILNELADKALYKTRTQQFSTNSNRLSMYNHVKPKLGSCYAQGWKKKLSELTKTKVIMKMKIMKNLNIDDKHSYYRKMVYEKPVLLKKDKNLNYNNVNINCNLDNINTVVQEHSHDEELNLNINETNDLFHKQIENKKLVFTDETINLPISSKQNKFTTASNVGLFIFKENIWRKFPIKNVNISKNDCLNLNISQENIKIHCSYKKQIKKLSLITEHPSDVLSNVAELIMDDIINEVLSKIQNSCDSIIEELFKMELCK